jgi:hypothetical protein
MEIDFVVETGRERQDRKAGVVCIEVKLSEKWDRAWEKPMRSMAASDRIGVEKMIGVYTGVNEYEFDGVKVLPYKKFVSDLHAGNLF